MPREFRATREIQQPDGFEVSDKRARHVNPGVVEYDKPLWHAVSTEEQTPMSNSFWTLFAGKATALESAIADDDAETLVEITDELARVLVAENPQLNLNIGGRDPFRMSILPLPGAERLAYQFVGSAPRIVNWEILAGMPEYVPLEIVHVIDEHGLSLEIRHDQLDAKVLPPKDGLATIVLSLDLEFDATGPESHLYNAVAENVIFTVLGGWPHELSKVVLLPRGQTGPLLSLETLRNQWLRVVGTGKP
ncbi:MAG: hypothetical protein KDB14_11685 [Planctomycetales bacterium]|nr:hypothetical protein [Planctomycetales bacterium]